MSRIVCLFMLTPIKWMTNQWCESTYPNRFQCRVCQRDEQQALSLLVLYHKCAKWCVDQLRVFPWWHLFWVRAEALGWFTPTRPILCWRPKARWPQCCIRSAEALAWVGHTCHGPVSSDGFPLAIEELPCDHRWPQWYIPAFLGGRWLWPVDQCKGSSVWWVLTWFTPLNLAQESEPLGTILHWKRTLSTPWIIVFFNRHQLTDSTLVPCLMSYIRYMTWCNA